MHFFFKSLEMLEPFPLKLSQITLWHLLYSWCASACVFRLFFCLLGLAADFYQLYRWRAGLQTVHPLCFLVTAGGGVVLHVHMNTCETDEKSSCAFVLFLISSLSLKEEKKSQVYTIFVSFFLSSYVPGFGTWQEQIVLNVWSTDMVLFAIKYLH